MDEQGKPPGPHTNPYGVPWGFPPAHLPPPPPQPQAKGNGLDAAKILTMVLAVAAIVFGAGKLVQKQENTDNQVKDMRVEQSAFNRQTTDSIEKMKSTVTDMALQQRQLNEQFRRINITGPNRPRRARHTGGGAIDE